MQRSTHRENYGRLDAWQWAEYDRIVYLDADCMVVGGLEPLFRMPRGLLGAVGAVFSVLATGRLPPHAPDSQASFLQTQHLAQEHGAIDGR